MTLECVHHKQTHRSFTTSYVDMYVYNVQFQCSCISNYLNPTRRYAVEYVQPRRRDTTHPLI